MMKRRTMLLAATVFAMSQAQAGRMLKGRAGGGAPPPPAPAGQAPSTPFVLAENSSAGAGTITHVVQAPTLYADGTTAISNAITYRTYRGTNYLDVLAGADGPVSPSSSSSTTYSASSLAPGTYYVMTTAVVDGVEGYGMCISYTVP